MSGSELGMHLRSCQDGPVVAATGRLEAANVGSLLHVVAAAMRIGGVHTISVDLSQIVFLDTTAVAGLLECRHHALRRGASFTVIAESGRAQHVLSVCGAVALLPHQMASGCCLRGTRHVLIAARRRRFRQRISCGRKM